MALQTKQDHRLPAQLAARLAQRIENHALRPGTRLPSIRNCAEESRVSRSTVVEAYDQLIAAGLIESRRGSGFYVRLRQPTRPRTRRAAAPPPPGTVLDVSWLLRAQRRQSPGSEQPGAGLLPEDWLDHEMVAAAVRGVGRSRGSWLLKYGAVEGYLPLREALSTRLAHAGIVVAPEQIVTTAGATQAIDLVARRFLAPGDVVFVEDPAWFVMFARFAAFGARIVGVPRGADGPDIAALESLLARERPKLFILNSVAHNPTGSCMSAEVAARVLELAARHDFMILEDDIYGDLQGRHAVRLASLDDGRRVIYVGGFSKTLAANLRVGFVAAHPALARELRDIKALTGLVVQRARRTRGRAHHHRAQLRTHARTPAHQARRMPGAHRRGAAPHGREDRGPAAGRHVPMGGLRSRHQRARHGRQPRRRVVRAGQPVLAHAAAEHLDARRGGDLPQRNGNGVPARAMAALDLSARRGSA